MDAGRVSFFKDLYEDRNNKVPALEVLLIQTGDPKTAFLSHS